MKTKLIIIIALIISSCSNQRRFSYEAVNLQEGEISKYHHMNCTVVSINPTMRGYKHLFVTPKNDTIVRYYAKPLEKNRCYNVWKTRTEKTL